ncbi:MAG: hypothetical protein IPP33_08445 [Flavobacteriales bacterium]|nr:hypothetical protein [Flavobacteriales bacterium]
MINNGDAGILGYYGYDYLGNKLTTAELDSSSAEMRSTAKTLFSRLQAPFQPIYVAGYVDVNDAATPTSGVGYRSGDRWFNSSGQELTDPSVLRAASGIQPFLIGYETDESGDLPGSKLRKDAFRVYDPIVNVMPRVAFSFPISDQAVFFAHYDVLTQRPTSNSRLDLLEYACIVNTNNTLNNPALKPTKP